MKNSSINKAYRILFWAVLCSVITLDLDMGVKFSSEILFYILFATGTNLLYDETKEPCFKTAYAFSMAGIAIYVLLFVAAYQIEDNMVNLLLMILSSSLLSLCMVTTLFLGAGQILPALCEKMRTSANIYASATTVITLLQVIFLFWKGSALIGALQIAVQIWVMTVLASCRKNFPLQEQGPAD